jgi:hypothetical protein
MSTSFHRRLSPTVLSAALLVLAALWFVSAWVFHVTNLHSKDGFFGAPVWALVLLVLVPLTSLVLAPCLVQERRSEGGRLHLVDYVALAAAVAPLVFVGALFLVVLLRYG